MDAQIKSIESSGLVLRRSNGADVWLPWDQWSADSKDRQQAAEVAELGERIDVVPTNLRQYLNPA